MQSFTENDIDTQYLMFKAEVRQLSIHGSLLFIIYINEISYASYKNLFH